ncbi:MAG: hypothetical protein EOO48_06630 [Flavobacterium sp.]|nr:MAG: hypothetical protein EOO48_06630 [Flavobacterium sp.]
MKKIFCFLFLIAAAFSSSAQKINELYANSIKCRQHQKYDCFLRFTQQLDSIKPSNSTYVYNLACAYALNEMPEKALSALEKSVLMDADTKFEADADLESLKALPGYQNILKLKADLQKQTANSSKVTTLTEKDLHPEGLTYLSKSKTWLATSVRKGKIVSFDIKKGICKDWLNVEGVYSVLAMKADASEKYLWVATVAAEQWTGYKSELKGKSEILKVDIKSRKIVQRFKALGDHVFGDLVVAKSGVVYISDSYTAGVYKIDSDEITHWLDLSGRTYNLQGLTLSGDETKIYVADYFSGILEVEVGNVKNRKWLDFPAGTVTKGIDGLTWYDNSLVAIHNGVKPIRIVRYFLNDSGDKIVGFKLIDNNRREFNEPALGCLKDKMFYFFANSPWNAYDKSNNLDESKFGNPMLFSFSL